jgi:hypothetical protein
MVFDDINDIPKHYPDVDVALFHLGGPTVLGIVVTMDAKEGWRYFELSIQRRSYLSTTMITMFSSHLLRNSSRS